MLFSILSFPEIVSKAFEDSARTPGGLEALLLPPAWGDLSEVSGLGRTIRSAIAESPGARTDDLSGIEGALTILGAFFAERAPVVFCVLPEHSPIRLRALASADEYGLVLDVGLERVLLSVLEREDLIKVADDLCVGHGEGRTLTVQSGVDDVFPAVFDSGEVLVRSLGQRPAGAGM